MSPCPSEQVLRAFLGGAVTAAEEESVGQHLSACPDCLRKLDGLGETPDPLVGALRGAVAVPASTWDEPAVLEMLGLAQLGGASHVGERVGPYRLLGKLGEGGMGAVYKARHEKLGKVFALKVLPPGRHSDPARTVRFEREMLAVGRLEHPHIVRATDAGEHDGVLFLAMELVDGTDLSRLVRRRGPLRVADACEIVRQAALALQHAHEKGLIHRDVKPSNLLLTPDGAVKLLDLGLALAVEEPEAPAPVAADAPTETAGLTLTGLALGTRDYMAPEQATDPHGVDLRADIYGLGATLHFLLTGKPPGAAATPPPVVADVLGRMLARRPEERFGTAAEVAAAAGRRARGHDLTALAAGRDPRSARKRRAYASAAVVLVLVGGLTAAAIMSRGGRAPDPPAAGGPEIAAGPQPAPVPPPAAGVRPPEEAPPPRPKPLPPAGRVPMTVDEARDLQQAWADFLGQPVVEGGPAGVQTVLIPPGVWELAPRYHVTITKPYRLGTTEVTRKQFLTFRNQTRYIPTLDQAELFKALGTSARPRNETGTWQEPGFPASDETPMTHVSRADAEAFVEWLSRTDGKQYRLPTEAEWRWACRSGAATRWPFGDDPKDLGYYARYKNNTRGFPERVGVLRPNAWGLYDMLGNVREWVADGSGPYPEGRFTDPTVPAKNGMYMLCGGDFNGETRYSERQPGYGSATCDCSTATARYWYLCTKTGGFRVCREP